MRAFGLIVAASMSACMPDGVTLKSAFDPASVLWAREPGQNTIAGSAMFRTRGGEVRTCAGLEVYLIPVSVYAKEHMMYTFGNVTRGYNPANFYDGHHPTFLNDSRAYYANQRMTRCDPDGRFEFEALPDGLFYLLSQVVWEVDSDIQGGALMQRVELHGGNPYKLVMTAP